MTDEELNRQAVDFAAEHGASYLDAIRAVQLIDTHRVGADRARCEFAQGRMPSDERLTAYAEVEAIKRGISFGEAMEGAIIETKHAQGAQRFHAALRYGQQPSEQDMSDAALMMAAQGATSYSEALHHLGRIVEFGGDPMKAIEVAFSEGRPITDDMAHVAAMSHMVNTGADYLQSLHHVLETMPAPVGAQFMEAAAGADAQKGIELEIFRAGTHTDSGGKKHTFTREDVQGMAQSYSPAIREAPMVKGHPGDDAPAYGWIASLRATEDGRLLAMVKQWDEDFLNELKAGRYKKRSASFYPPHHSSNPVPGMWYLRHLGWLGGMQPAIAGLADAAFQAPEVDTVEFTR